MHEPHMSVSLAFLAIELIGQQHLLTPMMTASRKPGQAMRRNNIGTFCSLHFDQPNPNDIPPRRVARMDCREQGKGPEASRQNVLLG